MYTVGNATIEQSAQAVAILQPRTVLSLRHVECLKAARYFAAGACVGLCAWNFGSHIATLLCVLALPMVWARTPSRWTAALLMGGYFMASGAGAIPGIPVFFGDPSALWMGLAACLLFTVAATLPFAVLWTTSSTWRPWQFICAIAILTLPPVGAVGMLNPIAAAGALCAYLPALPSLGSRSGCRRARARPAADSDRSHRHRK